jgi:nucleoside-diphosphate-sugar epimerase
MIISILGCGWFGLPLARSLSGQNFKVKGSTTSSEKILTLKAAGIDPFLIDLSAPETVYNPDFFVCDVLIIAIPPKSRSGEGAEYVPKLKRVIKAINQHSVKKVILISSTGVYADLNREVNESTPPQPDTASSKILCEAEELFRRQTGFKTTIIRFGGLIGQGREPGRFFAGKKDIPNGEAPVNIIHLNDCIGITTGVINKDAFGHTFNACTPHHPPKSDFYTRAAAKAGFPLPEFVAELKEWKLISSIHVPQILGYPYKISNWDDWLR